MVPTEKVRSVRTWPTVDHCLEMHTAIRNDGLYEARLKYLIQNASSGQDPPDVLCHYTSVAGLNGILAERAIWATSHRDMDDRKELRAVDEIVDQEIANLLKSTHGSANEVLQRFAEHHPARRAADLVTTYLRCFTAESDSLPHWEKFTDGGTGVCLELRMLRDEPPPNYGAGVGTSILPVEYQADLSRARVRAGFAAVLEACNDIMVTRTDPEWRLRRRTVVALAQIAAMAAVAAKEGRYSDEKEWRHVVVPYPKDRIPVRTTPGGKRYLSLPLRADGKLLFIERLVVRSPDRKSAVERATRILSAAGYPSADAPMPEVKFSSHPLPL